MIVISILFILLGWLQLLSASVFIFMACLHSDVFLARQNLLKNLKKEFYRLSQN